MAGMTDEIQQFVREQKLGFVATVNPDGTPNLSPKGSLTVWDDHHLVFADLRSPGTVTNLKQNPAIEVNVVDSYLRKGYRFKGTAEVLTEGKVFEQIVNLYEADGLADAVNRIQSVVLITVERTAPLISPGYDLGSTEEQVLERWEDYYSRIHQLRYKM